MKKATYGRENVWRDALESLPVCHTLHSLRHIPDNTYFTASLPAVSEGIIQKPDSREERVHSRLEQENTAEYG